MSPSQKVQMGVSDLMYKKFAFGLAKVPSGGSQHNTNDIFGVLKSRHLTLKSN